MEVVNGKKSKKLKFFIRVLKELGLLNVYVFSRKKCGYDQYNNDIIVLAEKCISFSDFINRTIYWEMSGHERLWIDLYKDAFNIGLDLFELLKEESPLRKTVKRHCEE